MFERNHIESRVAKGKVSAQITLDDGRVLVGEFIIPVNKSFYDVINGTGGFLEFEPLEGEAEFISKNALRSVKLLRVPRGDGLKSRLRNLDGFDPHAILGVARGASWEAIRSSYLRLAKDYHPDRFANTDLPEEVRNYLANMAQRVTTAYGALETQYQIGRSKLGAKGSAEPAEPVFTAHGAKPAV